MTRQPRCPFISGTRSTRLRAYNAPGPELAKPVSGPQGITSGWGTPGGKGQGPHSGFSGNRVQVPACCHQEHHKANKRPEEKLMVNREGSGPLRDPRSGCTLPTRHSTSNERLLCAWTRMAHSGRNKDGRGSQRPVGDPLAKGDPAPMPWGFLLFKETLLQTSL